MDTSSAKYKKGMEKLRGLLVTVRKTSVQFREMVEDRDAVIARFQPLFAAEALDKLDADRFKAFLLFENNRHWSGLHRQGGRICVDMKTLRSALRILLDEQKPIGPRWDRVAGSVSGMGKAIMSAILLVARPDRYGVWNRTSESGLRELGLWPDFDHGTRSGEKYAVVNTLLNQLAMDLEIDLWTLDSLFWWAKVRDRDKDNGGDPPPGTQPPDCQQQSFGLERHLHDFLFDNWGSTELGQTWALHVEDNDPESAYDYVTDVGEIDLLAKHKQEPRWLIVELKRAQTSDETVGQVLRYIGWVRRNLASADEEVEGLIIARSVDDRLRYAAREVPHVQLMEYRVQFSLQAAKGLDEVAARKRKR